MGTKSLDYMAKAAPAKKSPAKKAAPKKTIKKKATPAKKKAAPAKKSPKKKTAKKGTGKKDKKDKVKRAPSAYNVFMKKELDKLKKSHASLDHKARFAMAAANWSKSKK